MYHSEFYQLLNTLNLDLRWRKIIKRYEPDLHSKDIGILIKSFAMLISGDNYKPSLVKFLNEFSKKSRNNDYEKNKYLQDLFISFLVATEDLPADAFINQRNKRFNVVLLEAAFYAVCRNAFENKRVLEGKVDEIELAKLANDDDFIAASIEGTTRSDNISARLKAAKNIMTPL